ncbi:MAG TPA: hypothetical protein DD435_01715 [Cyanobacteria bacterium UBA8530]|nr:hypothetical protein [Cyanobacteria bacterium UBA8530]
MPEIEHLAARYLLFSKVDPNIAGQVQVGDVGRRVDDVGRIRDIGGVFSQGRGLVFLRDRVLRDQVRDLRLELVADLGFGEALEVGDRLFIEARAAYGGIFRLSDYLGRGEHVVVASR